MHHEWASCWSASFLANLTITSSNSATYPHDYAAIGDAPRLKMCSCQFPNKLLTIRAQPNCEPYLLLTSNRCSTLQPTTARWINRNGQVAVHGPIEQHARLLSCPSIHHEHRRRVTSASLPNHQRGIPQGSVLSPTLFNLAMFKVDRTLRSIPDIEYAISQMASQRGSAQVLPATFKTPGNRRQTQFSFLRKKWAYNFPLLNLN